MPEGFLIRILKLCHFHRNTVPRKRMNLLNYLNEKDYNFTEGLLFFG